ncbi:MAG: ABC transporter substrate-binding protein, partial [Burkholderiales bacterium]|nr:ABC transporter substrate-binding protein [Burkholderiales bacterium]
MAETEKRRLGKRPRAIGKQLVQSVMPLRLRIGAISWRDLAVTLGPFLITGAILIGCVFWFLDPAPPSSITMSTGPEGSSFQRQAEQYKKILARNGIKVTLLSSEGSLENLHRLQDPKSKVDVTFVLDGVVAPGETDGLVSLGSVSHQPLFVFYRADHEITSLSEFEGKHISIGPIGSGARVLATAILKANGIEQGGD